MLKVITNKVLANGKKRLEIIDIRCNDFKNIMKFDFYLEQEEFNKTYYYYDKTKNEIIFNVKHGFSPYSLTIGDICKPITLKKLKRVIRICKVKYVLFYISETYWNAYVGLRDIKDNAMYYLFKK